MRAIVLTVFVLIGSLLFAFDSRPALGASFVVDTNVDDPGITLQGCGVAADDCSLRGAITRANLGGAGDVITFDATDFPSGAPATITIGSSLPSLTAGGDTIDGAGAGVIIATTSLQAFDCLVVASDGNTIANIQVGQCDEAFELLPGADNNIIGPGNVIFQNSTGVADFGGSGNTIRGNKVGTDATGSAIHPSGANTRGIEADGLNTVIGGATAADRNIISGNSIGVAVFGSGATIQGNYIGTDVSGTADLGNTSSGVSLQALSGHTVGGTNPGEGNVISGNASSNVILNNTTNSTVAGNIIGPDVNGSGAAMLNGNGILVAGTSTGNTIGPGNVIADNTIGVNLSGSAVATNVVKGNRIGTNLAGTDGVPNSSDNVRLENGAHDNTIGGTTAADRNIISAQTPGTAGGIRITGAATTGNLVFGNYVGTDVTGTVDLGNNSGIRIEGSAPGNTIGGIAAGEGNLISGNGTNIFISVAGTGNTVAGNIIGPDANGTGGLLNGTGIFVNAPGTTIGPANVISDNTGGAAGVHFSGSVTQNNLVMGNLIGTDLTGTAALPNVNGVLFENSAQNNTIGGTAPGDGNVIAFNTSDGVRVSGVTATGNAIRGNSIHDNGAFEISLVSSGNTGLAAPTLSDAGSGAAAGTACPDCQVDVFSDGAFDAEFYEGSTTADGSGNWVLYTPIAGPNVTATNTDSAGNTSQLSDPLGFTPDGDGDGVPDDLDNCLLTDNGPDQADIFGVGYQNDADGDGILGAEGPEGTTWGGDACDVDDDNDGKPDSSDGCRIAPEDYDQFEDGDGCPDADNDGDGICDAGLVSISCTGSDVGRYLWQAPLPEPQDCRNVPEDYDSFHDDDGCPEPDNDYDTYPDYTDDCPGTDFTAGPDGIADTGDEPTLYLTPVQTREDFDGVIDNDGCHDSPGDDYDGDGFSDEAEVFDIGTKADDPCGGDAWPADLAGNDNRLNIGDFNSFLFPLRGDGSFAKFDHPVPDPDDPNIERWNLQSSGGGAGTINIGDLNALNPAVIAPTSRPPMFGGQPAFFTNAGSGVGVCPFPP